MKFAQQYKAGIKRVHKSKRKINLYMNKLRSILTLRFKAPQQQQRRHFQSSKTKMSQNYRISYNFTGDVQLLTKLSTELVELLLERMRQSQESKHTPATVIPALICSPVFLAPSATFWANSVCLNSSVLVLMVVPNFWEPSLIAEPVFLAPSATFWANSVCLNSSVFWATFLPNSDSLTLLNPSLVFWPN